MSLQKKFVLVLLVASLFSAMLIALNVRTLRSVEAKYQHLASETFPLILALEDLRYAALRIVSSTSEYALVAVIGEDPDEDEEENAQQENEGGEIDEAIEGMENALGTIDLVARGTDGLSAGFFTEIRSLASGLEVQSHALRNAMIMSDGDDLDDVNEIKEIMEDLEGEILELVNSEIVMLRSKVEAEYAAVHAGIVRTIAIVAGSALALATLLAMLWGFVVRYVIKPVAQLGDATVAVSEGHFDNLPKARTRDEVGKLTTAFGKMAENLQRLIREKQHAIDVAQDNERRFRDIAEAASDWIWETDAEHRVTFLSERFATVTGIDLPDAIGRPFQSIVIPEMQGDQSTEAGFDLDHKLPVRDVRCRISRMGKELSICRVAGKPLFNEDGAFLGYRGTATDISAQVGAEREAQHLALHDALTGLPNRLLLAERLRQSLAEAKRDAEDVAVICLDLDRFKEVNDTLGHAAGDTLLKEVSARLSSIVRDTDTVARLGGDEFVVVQTCAPQPSSAHALCERILQALREAVVIEGQTVFAGASLGVSLAPYDGADSDSLLKNADIAMYRSKNLGRGKFCFFEQEMNDEIQKRRALESDLRQAISNDELELHFQPLISRETGQTEGFEALVRWNRPEHGLIAPDEFIPLAEETGLILPLGEWVLRQACQEATHWDDLFVAVNLSPVQFRDQNLMQMIADTLEETGLPPARLELEITESVLLSDADYAFVILDNLRELGVRIAMDDFGTGYSSLSYLQRFEFDKIKLDRGFIGAVEVSEDAKNIVKAVIMLGKSLGMTTTAEGVENKAHIDFLTGEGCDQFQGYYFSKPMTAAAVRSFLKKGADQATG